MALVRQTHDKSICPVARCYEGGFAPRPKSPRSTAPNCKEVDIPTRQKTRRSTREEIENFFFQNQGEWQLLRRCENSLLFTDDPVCPPFSKNEFFKKCRMTGL